MNTQTQHTIEYKNSPLGLIPHDWELKTIGEIIKLSSGKTKPKLLLEIKHEEYIYPVFGGNGIIGYSNEYNSEGKVILIGRVGELCGITRLVEDKCWITDNALYTKEIQDQTDIVFLTFKLQYENLSKLRNKGGQPLVSQTPIYSLKISIAKDVKEQKAIADCLSTWDKAIEKLNALIAQKELSKKALMQQLLSGKKRLKGFSSEWKECHIKDIAKEVSVKNKTDKQLTVLSCTKYNGLVPSLEYFGRKIYADDISTYKIVPKHHFAYATNHIEEGSIGYQGKFDEALISPMYTVFKTSSSIDDNFLFLLLKSHKMIFQYNARMEGSIDRRGGLRWDAFSIIKINLPSIEEQTAIANVLKTNDDELQLLKKKLEQLKEQKKGLMQVLLTGKKRLKF